MKIFVILGGFGQRKTNPNKANLISPPDSLGVENEFEKTKPIIK